MFCIVAYFFDIWSITSEIVVILTSIYGILKIIKYPKYRLFLNNKFLLLFILFWLNGFLVSSFNYIEMPKKLEILIQ